MESLASETSPQIEIHDTEQIASVVEALSYHTHALSISVEASSVSRPVTLRGLDHERRVLSLSLLDAQSLDAAELVNQPLTLSAEGDTETLLFEGMVALEVVRNNDRLEIRSSLPGTLHTTSKRNSTRVFLLEGMQVKTGITLYENQPPIIGRLRNLSIGGALLEVPLANSAPLKTDEFMAQLELSFPNGEVFTTMGQIRHVNPAGRSHFAAIGVIFINTDRAHEQRLIYLVNETERETAYRTGEGGRMSFPSPLYSSSDPGYRRNAKRQKSEEAPMVGTLLEVARQLHIFLLALQNQRPLPANCLFDSADILLTLLNKQRQNLFYALHCLHQQPTWVQHSLNVAVRLGDLVLSESDHAPRAREVVIAALVHDMGKPMLIDDTLPSIEGTLDIRQRDYLRRHVPVLMEALEGIDWLAPAMRHDVIQCINERLDGSGYPQGCKGDALSPIARMAAVVDTVDAMTRARGGRRGKTAIEAYRYLYHRPECFDKQWVTRYIQRHGFYPIGSLVKFSGGFLAWVMELDDSGQPRRVRVVRNLKREDRTMNDILSRVDFAQLGTLESLMRPEGFGLAPY
ncbi:HD domain-containing phosphohydrolase [Kushneria indalinina]|uniref:HD domain-containing protein n=1 Tax=Kushneria indalinina DSM 14324 TaxID=1122140 RepID=A0A3D9DWD8_9GAMM|nr:HD domain-containing phosphohydrolase [Kushneria indalinina]REC94709.1 HD domain-containing protein [Kushneria indalinina DSM 14324]